MHGHSPTYGTPTIPQVASRHARGGATTVAHLLLHDPQLRVRHAAAATITALLEGPAQRAYLAVAEARELDRQPVRYTLHDPEGPGLFRHAVRFWA